MSKDLVKISNESISQQIKLMGLNLHTEKQLTKNFNSHRSLGTASILTVGLCGSAIASFLAGLAYSDFILSLVFMAPLTALSLFLGNRISKSDSYAEESFRRGFLELFDKDYLSGFRNTPDLVGAYAMFLKKNNSNDKRFMAYSKFIHSSYIDEMQKSFDIRKKEAEKFRILRIGRNMGQKDPEAFYRKMNQIHASSANQDKPVDVFTKKLITGEHIPLSEMPLRNNSESVQKVSIGQRPVFKNKEPEIQRINPPVRNTMGNYEKVVLKYKKIKRQWFETQSDIVKLLKYPLLNDLREPLVREFHKILNHAENVFPENKSSFSLSHPFVECISDLEVAYQSMMSEAVRVADAKFSQDERKKVSLAKKLMNIALDEAGTPEERQSAYKRAMNCLEGLIVLPKNAILEVEGSIRMKEIDA